MLSGNSTQVLTSVKQMCSIASHSNSRPNEEVTLKVVLVQTEETSFDLSGCVLTGSDFHCQTISHKHTSGRQTKTGGEEETRGREEPQVKDNTTHSTDTENRKSTTDYHYMRDGGKCGEDIYL